MGLFCSDWTIDVYRWPKLNAIEKAMHAAENSAPDSPDLAPLTAEAEPRRSLARSGDGTPTRKTQRNFTDPDIHLMQSGASYLQHYNCQPTMITR
jgi:hypothetical protein